MTALLIEAEHTPAAAPLRAVIYARVSSDPTQEIKSVKDQVAVSRRDCAERGWNLIEVFQENDRSASRYAKRERPEYKRLINYLRSGAADVLVTWESSRAQRDLAAYLKLREICEENGVLWCYKGRVFDLSRTDDKFSTGLDALLAERESSETRDRVIRGQRMSAEQGRPPGRVAFGYTREYDPHTKAFLRQVVREDQAVIVREIVRRYASGEGVPTIKIDLNRRGIRTSAGHVWCDMTVKRTATNPTYLGKRVYRGRVIGDGQWPALLKGKDVDAFYAGLRRANRLRISQERDGKAKYLLSNIAVCGVCGGRMRSIPAPRSTKKNYVCAGTPTNRGACVTILVERLDTYVMEWIIERLSRPDAADLLAQDDQGTDVIAAMAEASELCARLDEFYDSAAAGRLTETGLAKIEAQLLPQIEAAEQRAQAVNVAPVLKDVIRPDIAEIWPALPVAQQREVVRTLVTVTLHTAKVKGRVKFDPSRVDIAWKQDL